MPAKRSQNAKRQGQARRAQAQAGTANDLVGVAIIVVALSMVVALASPSTAIVTHAVAEGLRLGFGTGAMLVPIALILFACTLFLPTDNPLVGRVALGLGLVVLSALSMLSILAPEAALGPDAVLAATVAVEAGGYVGSGVAWLLLTLVGQVVGMVVLVGLAVAGIVVCGFSISNLALKIRRSMGAAAERVREARERGATRRADEPTDRLDDEPWDEPDDATELVEEPKTSQVAEPKTSFIGNRKTSVLRRGARPAAEVDHKTATLPLERAAAPEPPAAKAVSPEPATALLRRRRHPELDIEGARPAGEVAPEPAAAATPAPSVAADVAAILAGDAAEGAGATASVAARDGKDDATSAASAPEDGAIPDFLLAAAGGRAARPGAEASQASRDVVPSAGDRALADSPRPQGTRPKAQPAPAVARRPGDGSDDFVLPPLSLLKSNPNSASSASSDSELERTARRLQSTLEEFGLTSRVSGWTAGPLVTTFKIEMGEGERVSKITNLQDDIQLSLASESVRIFAPIPGTSLVGIEIPNKTRQNVCLGDVLPYAQGGPLEFAIGRDSEGAPVVADLARMPHMLVAGTTGSGKSEFIITYVLSLCVNYAPDEVAFVLIDYKGGGLAGAFDNDRFRLPHLAGTITNLDGAAISRSLVSIKSELKRRQDLFNRARDITGEATVDIYKYLRFYRQGTLKEPCPHLFIVADEFAELKQQEPEFMDELISAARIGRSLGVHLILATQKPSGVVNDQIWSNSRFKVCLKVADAADSKEMIRRPDAAEIKGPGRFFMLVGYNELFCGGQAAYAGSPYAPTDVFEPRRDDSVELVDDTADVISSARPASQARSTGESELNAVLGALCQTADATGCHAGRLWLDPLPARIAIGALREKYGFVAAEGGCEVALGEVDDPGRQRQLLYRVDLASVGNLMVFGAQGSGAEALVATLLYSLALDYNPEEVSFYAMDFGSGTLSAFSTVPQCGGVVLSGDTERLGNLLRLVDRIIAERRETLARSGLTLEEHNARAERGERIGHVVVALVNVAAFYDLFPELEDKLVTLTREGSRYGIHFVVTAGSATAARMRLRSNFSENVVLGLNDDNDILTILGKRPKAVVPKRDKRGYVVLGKEAYEFQGASIAAEGSSEAESVDELARARSQACAGRAVPIPMLPAEVHASDMGPVGTAAGTFPVGFAKLAVEPTLFSFSSCPTMLVLGNDIEAIARYLRGARESLARAGSGDYLFVDTSGYLGEVDDERVVQDAEEASARVAAVASGRDPVGLLVFTSIIETMSALTDDASRMLKDYLTKEQCKGVTGVVAASEMWRARSLYDEWYKVVSAYGNGVWVGSGFGDQTAFRFAHSLSEYRAPAATDDGFYALRGDVVSVRLVSAEGDGQR